MKAVVGGQGDDAFSSLLVGMLAPLLAGCQKAPKAKVCQWPGSNFSQKQRIDSFQLPPAHSRHPPRYLT